MQNPISSYEMDGVIEIGGGGCSYVCIRKKSVSSYVRDGVMKQCWLHATCGRLLDAYKLVEGLRSLKVGVDHMALHDGMFIHAGIMDRGIQNDLYTIMLWLSFTLNMENRGCLVIVNVGVYWMHVMTQRWYREMLNINMMRKIDLVWTYGKFMVCFNYWRSVQSSLSKEGFHG